MVEVQIMNIHDFMSVEEGFSMLLSVKFAAQDLLPVWHRALVLNLSKYASLSPNIMRVHIFCALNRGSSFLLDAPPQTVIP